MINSKNNINNNILSEGEEEEEEEEHEDLEEEENQEEEQIQNKGNVKQQKVKSHDKVITQIKQSTKDSSEITSKKSHVSESIGESDCDQDDNSDNTG